jgi:SsrA-binding protein
VLQAPIGPRRNPTVRRGCAISRPKAGHWGVFFCRACPYMEATMARPQNSVFDKAKTVAENRKARFDYHIEDKFEAGIALTGTEGSIVESFAEIRGGECWLVNANVPEFSHGNRFNHVPKRPRKLLLHEREISRLQGAVERKGMTLVPLS